ncbi:BON domain-containing protein [uncultured Microbulbifer sp.]|uniref:BON domain-containing protein n=1 Tax=uncultured Microbulbifer sp. TaxID=348147 RepID=UPI0026371E7B|nr:BON domain-containing protein [uncultured Microbulbifer sp.]
MQRHSHFSKSALVSIIAGTVLTLSATTYAADDAKNGAMSDAWLDGKAETILLLNENLNNFTINTDVSDGVVQLTGEVESNVDRRLAEELIASVDGVKSVQNKLTIANEEPIGEKINRKYVDTKIATVVKTRLLMDREVAGTDIDVASKNGTIILRGFVESDAEKDLAEAIARNTNDVEKVQNKLKVSG